MHKFMVKFSIFISIVVLITSLVLLFNGLFTPQPLQITLESGQEITTSAAEYFALAEVLLMIICAFLIGTAATYLFYNSDQAKITSLPQQPVEKNVKEYDTLLPLLKTHEKQAIIALRDAGGEMQQNKLALKLGVSKVKATRILSGLEQKRLIIKERHGLTNMVKLRR